MAQVRGGALRRQEVCPQRRPVGRSRETLTCTLGERLGGRKGAGGGAEPEALTWRDR